MLTVFLKHLDPCFGQVKSLHFPFSRTAQDWGYVDSHAVGSWSASPKQHLNRLRAHTTKELKPVAINIVGARGKEATAALVARNQLPEAFKNHQKIDWVYEEKIQNNQVMPWSVNILEFQNEFEEPQLKKMNPSTLSLMLTNFDEWPSYFKNTDFAEMLE